MITKERLEELVKENGKVYYTQNHPLVSDGMWIDLTRAEIIPSQECVALDYKIYNGYGYVNCFPFKWLYETKEDAEEYLKYNNITREEKLELPFWNELKNKYFIYEMFRILGQSNKDCVIYYTRDNKDSNLKVTIRDRDEYQETIFNKPLTRENYNEARDLCIKLFKGEE